MQQTIAVTKRMCLHINYQVSIDTKYYNTEKRLFVWRLRYNANLSSTI